MKRKFFNYKFFCQVLIFVSILVVLIPSSLQAKTEFPTKRINLVCGWGSGGTTDVSLRALAKASEKYLGQPIMVVNKPGGGTVISLHEAMNEKPDGYHLVFLSASAVALTPHLRKVRYDPIKDFTPIMQYGRYTYSLVVRANAPWDTFDEFVEYAKKNPGFVSIGSGTANVQSICLKAIGKKEGIDWRIVPFPNTRSGVVACMGGHLTAAATSGGETPFVEAGKLKRLVVLMEHRYPGYPDVPTLIDLGYDYYGVALMSIVGPEGIPEEIVKKLDNAFKKAMSDPDFIKVMNNLNLSPTYRNSKELGERIKEVYHIYDIEEILGLRVR